MLHETTQSRTDTNDVTTYAVLLLLFLLLVNSPDARWQHVALLSHHRWMTILFSLLQLMLLTPHTVARRPIFGEFHRLIVGMVTVSCTRTKCEPLELAIVKQINTVMWREQLGQRSWNHHKFNWKISWRRRGRWKHFHIDSTNQLGSHNVIGPAHWSSLTAWSKWKHARQFTSINRVRPTRRQYAK